MKIRPVCAQLFHVEGQTSRRTNRHDEVNSRYAIFLKAPQN